jgi:2'-5' RNA ligase
MPETAVVVLIPELELLIGEWRRRGTGDGARGMPAHVTLIYPFADTSALDCPLKKLSRVFAAFEPFDVTVAKAGRFPGLLYLRPEPPEQFVAMTEAIVDAFPEFPPYGGEFDEIVPHVTVAQADEDLLVMIEADLAAKLPVSARVERAWVVENAAEGWRRHTAFPLDRRRRV